ncbi:hypothetical protein [Brevundimonas sp.]|uniref:hypothetical protein n=1 Tax=Brevundimonas sp. TaxID=1871086 RepID=UPI0017EFD3F5|nr:hypothetical protein [Brevundimonas sp.]MBA4806218.1 hypothetical protein [Brevundimonas sp.]
MASEPDPSVVDVIQAGAAVLAVLAGFGYVAFQRWADSRAAGRAAAHLARHSLDFVTERLDALIDDTKPFEFALRGARAAEMIEVFRELELSRIPADWIERIAIIRSAVFAINSRIDEVLRDDDRRKSERRRRLHSAGRILAQARAEMSAVRGRFLAWNRGKFTIKALSGEMTAFLAEAERAAPSAATSSPTPAI